MRTNEVVTGMKVIDRDGDVATVIGPGSFFDEWEIEYPNGIIGVCAASEIEPN